MDPIGAISKVLGIDKLIDYGASGVGAIAGPLLAPWKASREGKARLTATKFDAEIREIEARRDANAMNIIAEAQSEARAHLLPSDSEVRVTLDITREDIAQSIEFQGRKRLANARAVLEGAADELEDKEVDDHEPDPDWTARFFDCVQDVSSEDMQKLWAKILAGEVESPGRTSLRTLDVLRNMTKKEAEMFNSICNLAIENSFVFYDRSVKGFPELEYAKLLHLQDCGLLNLGFGQAMNVSFGYGEVERFMSYQNGGLVIVRDQSEQAMSFRLDCLVFSSVGKELLQFTKCKPNREYLCAFSKFLQGKKCRLDYFPNVVHVSEGMIGYSRRISIPSAPSDIEESFV